MAIGKRKSDSRLAELKWDCAIGNYVLEERVYANSEWETQQTNIANDKFRAVFDMPNLEVGYVGYIKGLGRDTVLVKVGQDYGERPSDKHREGLRLVAKLDESLGGIVCEFLSTLSSVWQEIDKLHDDFLAELNKLKEREGHLPAVDVVDAHKEPGRKAPILVPIFKISGWVPRPPELPVAGIPIFKPTKKKDDDSKTAGSEATNGNGYERPKVADDMNDEVPF
jgi:hypothetical protein